MNHSKGQQSLLGITAGTTFKFFKVKDQSGSNVSVIKNRLTVGIKTSIGLTLHWGLMTLCNYIQKGSTLKGQGIQPAKIDFNVNYLEVPVNMVYNSNLPGENFFALVGPSCSIGFWGAGGSLPPIEVGVNFLAGINLRKEFL